jgi:hypothetical protein
LRKLRNKSSEKIVTEKTKPIAQQWFCASGGLGEASNFSNKNNNSNNPKLCFSEPPT